MRMRHPVYSRGVSPPITFSTLVASTNHGRRPCSRSSYACESAPFAVALASAHSPLSVSSPSAASASPMTFANTAHISTRQPAFFIIARSAYTASSAVIMAL